MNDLPSQTESNEHTQRRLIRTLAFALRHHPEQFGLTLDAEGWIEIDGLVESIRMHDYDWALFSRSDLEAIIAGMDRFEVDAGRIRASYGHSIRLQKLPPAAEPPVHLYHGTDRDRLPIIMQAGLQPMNRSMVHLTSSFQWAFDFVIAKPAWVILQIDAHAARDVGLTFRQANHHVWLVEHVDPSVITVQLTGGLAP